MASITHRGYTASAVTALTTELNSLANNANSSASAAIDNTTNLDMLMDLELVLAAQAVARSTGALIAVFIVRSLDGTNYEDVHELTATQIATFTLDAATTARRVTVTDVPIAPGKFKLFARNLTGQSFASSANTLSYRTRAFQSG